MTRYKVTGMSCAACSARVEKAVSKVDGVVSVAVNLLTGDMGVEGDVAPEKVIDAVVKAGYGATLADRSAATLANPSDAERGNSDRTADKTESEDTSALGRFFTAAKDKDSSERILLRVIISVIVVIPLMIMQMSPNINAPKIVLALMALFVMVINGRFFINGFRGLIHGAPNMDTLVALGSTASFIYGYYDSAAMILALISIGKYLEAKSKGKTTDAIKALQKLTPQVDIKVGEVFEIKPGESIPADAVVIEGNSAVDESALTGESIPVDKIPGDNVSAGTINQSGYLRCRATRVGSETTLSQIIRMVSDASATKAPIAKLADKVAGVFVPVVIGIAIVTYIVWYIAITKNPSIIAADFSQASSASANAVSFALNRAVSVLVISCPCALGLATPVAIMVGTGLGAKNGILFKTAEALQYTGKTDIVVLDKTGTITEGKPQVTDVVTIDDDLLKIAYALESKSEHPLGKAVAEYCVTSRNSVTDDAVSTTDITSGDGAPAADTTLADFAAHAGSGVSGIYNNEEVCGGNLKFITDRLADYTRRNQEENNVLADSAVLSDEVMRTAESFAEAGKTPLFFARNGKLTGIIAVADRIKPDSHKAIAELKEMNIRVVMLTGDNERTAKAIAAQAGIDEVFAGVLPTEKDEVIRKLQAGTRTGEVQDADRKSALPKPGNADDSNAAHVMMVGDGINDAPALTRADIGVAIGAGTDVAIDAADIVLMKSTLMDVPAAIRLSKATLKNVKQNLFWAFFYNAICIPLAAGVYYPPFGIVLNPMIGAAAMSLSSFCVVTNALRLNFTKIYRKGNDKAADTVVSTKASAIADTDATTSTETTNNTSEEKMMIKTTIEVTGMMCPNCERHMNEAIEKAFTVKSVSSSHDENKTVIESEAPLDEATLKKVVEDTGYVPGKITVE